MAPIPSSSEARLKSQQDARVAAAQERLLGARKALGLNQAHTFRLAGALTDRFGQTHARFQQLYRDVPVWGAMAVTHTDAGGLELELTDALQRGVKVDTTPALTREAAVSAARDLLKPRGEFSRAPSAELVVYPLTERVNLAPGKPAAELNALDFEVRTSGHVLAYHVHTELENRQDGVRHTDFIIDARSGQVLKSWNSLETASAAVGTGHSQYSGQVPLNVTLRDDGTYALTDTTRGTNGGNATYDVAKVENTNLTTSTPMSLYTDADNDWGDGTQFDRTATDTLTTANAQTAAVDAHYGLQTTWDYYGVIHGRNGIDGRGTRTYNRVHVGAAYDNAYWSDGCFCMSYGDGRGKEKGYFDTLTALDVAGHEMSHGVTSRTADLIYTGESGGLNEANSDIFGTMVQFWSINGRGATIGNTGGNWEIGEGASIYPLRYMYKPSLDGASADAWYPGIETIDVHYSSGPMNRAFYFLSQGAQSVVADASEGNLYSSESLPGGMYGIGNDRAAAIWYRALTVYLYPSANYAAARTAALRAAGDLFGSPSTEYRAVQNAFAAINVGTGAGGYDDTLPPTVIADVGGAAPVLELSAITMDDVGVVRTDFLVDGALVGSDSSLPFSMPLETTGMDNGAHQLVVQGYDAAGNMTASEPYTFQVTNSFTQLLTDPSFEQGGQGWVANPPENINVGASGGRTGSSFVWLNGWGSVHTDELYQDVFIPPSATRAALTFYLRLTTAETATTANDTLTVQVRDTAGTVLQTLATYSNLDTDLAYVQRSFDLSAYRGQEVRIYLVGQENASAQTSFRLDDFALRVTGADTEAPRVTARMSASGTRTDFLAEVSDNGAVPAVEFLVDGTSVGTATGRFAQTANLSSLSSGQHTLVARATDVDGNTADSAPVSFFLDTTRAQLVVNPGFEGSGGWGASVSKTNAVAIYTSSSFAHSGSRFAIFWSNVGRPNNATLYQTVTVPADATSAVYSFWLRIYSDAFSDGQAHDTITAKVQDAGGADLGTLETFSNLDDTGGAYHEHRYDLSAYKGQTVRIAFASDIVTAASGGTTQFFLDDITLTSSRNPDVQPPAVSASVAGTYGTVRLAATVSDNVWVRSVEFLVDGASIGSLANPNGKVVADYDMSALGAGHHQFQAVATDTAGNTSTATVDFDTLAPRHTDIVPPAVNVAVVGSFETILLTASLADDVAAAGVEFYVDGVFVGMAHAAPYTLAFDSAQVAYGQHTVQVVGRDSSGNTAEASAVFQRIPVSVTATGGVVKVGGSLQLRATVNGASNTAVSWSVQETGGGTVDEAGVFKARAQPGTYHVVATSQADGTKSAVATVTVFTPDINGDGIVDGEDLGRLSEAYGLAEGAPGYSADADLDASGTVNDSDINLFVTEFGR